MARVKLTEYKAKKLLLGEEYSGITIYGNSAVAVPNGSFVLKVDQGIKKRMKQGLVALKIAPSDFSKYIKEWEARGFTRFLAEPYLLHEASEERYLSLERVRDGIRIMYAREGGIEIEAHPEKVETYLIQDATAIAAVAKKTNIPEVFLTKLVKNFNNYFLAFLEINPLVVKEGEVHALDAAVLVDDAGEFFVQGAWTASDLVQSTIKNEAEASVRALQETSPASLKLSVLKEDGELFFLLSGGGGSIVIADEAHARGKGGTLGNYGEYSGGPTREETYLYAKEIVKLALSSKAGKKALVIAGGVANFTDVKSTFSGIIDALSEVADELRNKNVRVFVRRGGPREKEGLALIKNFLTEEKLLGSIYGSDAVITSAISDAIDYISV